MRARLARKLLKQLLSKQVEVLRVPRSVALALRVPTPGTHAKSDFYMSCGLAIMQATGMHVVVLCDEVTLAVVSATDVREDDIAKAQKIARQDESAGLTPSHITLASAYGCTAADLHGGDKNHLWEAYRVAFKAQRDAQWEPKIDVST